jgi:predicted O-methyltransferase YrrM
VASFDRYRYLMPRIPRPELREAAREWLHSDAAKRPEVSNLRTALTNFVENRYAGAAEELKKVHEMRRKFLGDERTIGSLSDLPGARSGEVTLDAAASASAPIDQGRLLFQLVRGFRPGRMIELGTNIGISGAYIGIGLRFGGGGQLITLEGSGARLKVAHEVFDELGIGGIETVEGRFDDVLPEVLERRGPIEAAFLDGNHRLNATLRYFEMLRGHMPSGSLMILDDIRWSDEMLLAWQKVSSSTAAEVAVDLGRTGLLVID